MGHVVGLKKTRWSYHATAQHVVCTDVTESQCWNQCEDTHLHPDCPVGSGHPRQTSPGGEHCVVKQNITEHCDFSACHMDTSIGLFSCVILNHDFVTGISWTKSSSSNV